MADNSDAYLNRMPSSDERENRIDELERELSQAKADLAKGVDLKNRYKAAFKQWVGFCKDWRARSDRWQEVAAQGELQLRELPLLRESYRKVLNLWHAWFPGCCCETDMPCPHHDKSSVEVEAMGGLGWGHPDALRSLQAQVREKEAENATLRASLAEAREAMGKAEAVLLRLRIWAAQSPTGPTEAHDIQKWVLRLIDGGLAALSRPSPQATAGKPSKYHECAGLDCECPPKKPEGQGEV